MAAYRVLLVLLLATSLGLAAIDLIDVTSGLPPHWRGGRWLVLSSAVGLLLLVLLVRRDARPSDR
jgi:hypothetical protein